MNRRGFFGVVAGAVAAGAVSEIAPVESVPLVRAGETIRVVNDGRMTRDEIERLRAAIDEAHRKFSQLGGECSIRIIV